MLERPALVKAVTALRASIDAAKPSARIRLLKAIGLNVLVGDAGITATINLNSLTRELGLPQQPSDEPVVHEATIDVPVRSVLELI